MCLIKALFIFFIVNEVPVQAFYTFVYVCMCAYMNIRGLSEYYIYIYIYIYRFYMYLI